MEYPIDMLERKVKLVSKFMMDNNVYFNFSSDGEYNRLEFRDTQKELWYVEYRSDVGVVTLPEFSEEMTKLPGFLKEFKMPISILLRWFPEIYEISDIVETNRKVLEKN